MLQMIPYQTRKTAYPISPPIHPFPLIAVFVSSGHSPHLCVILFAPVSNWLAPTAHILACFYKIYVLHVELSILYK
ncbi:expressed protein [Echinococcus multilocularis]|uniref:Expressed protein n=1 Tax=Echinococcus multilocularis TaxID=6211 RepID=A0A068Y3N9_ECHMU|nr:expressed protein [Echinococcus multilocularis]